MIDSVQDEHALRRDIRIKYSRNRRGVVRKQQQEIYLHDYASCGILECTKCSTIDEDDTGGLREDHERDAIIHLGEGEKILVLEESVAFNQVDCMLSKPCPFPNAVNLLSGLMSIRQRHQPTYMKLRDTETCGQHYVFPDCFFVETATPKSPGETTSEYTSRKAIVVAQWYCDHIGKDNVLLVTQGSKAKEAALAFGVPSITAFDYLESVVHQFPEGIERYRTVEEDMEDTIDEDGTEVEREEDTTNKKRPADGTIKFGKEVIGHDEDGLEIRQATNIQYSPYWSEETILMGLKAGTCVVGTLRMARNTCNYGFIQVNGLDDIRIENRLAINRSIDGDTVVVEVLGPAVSAAHADVADEVDYEVSPIEVLPERKSKKRKLDEIHSAMESRAGQVVSIRKRADRSYIGTIRPLSDARMAGASLDSSIERVIIPSSNTIPFSVIRTRSSALLEGMRIEYRIDGWPINSRYPRAHWTKVMGPCGDVNVESEVILHDHQVITREFSDAVLRCLPPKGFSIPEEEINKRVDLRKKNMPKKRSENFFLCSVDPPGCKDIDDALSCEFFDDGTIELGVHIADVTHFVRPDTAIDIEAAQRCTTVYLVDRRTDMLPGLLTTDLCSLVGKADRLAFSVIWHLDKQGNHLTEPRFHKSIICSDAAMTYEMAQNMIDDKKDKSGLAKGLRQILDISKIYRQARMVTGAVEMHNPETHFELNRETGEVEGCGIYKMFDTNRMIEEFMLKANIDVGKKIFNSYPSHSILRRHPPPQAKALAQLADDLKKYRDMEFPHGTSKELSESLNHTKDPNDTFFQTMVSMQVLRCMNAAIYFCSGDKPVAGDAEIPENFWHYGLATPIYTHFTSPIRRYADVLVHRLLAASLDIDRLPSQCQSKDGLVAQAKIMSQKHRDAQWASRSSGDFAAYKFFKKLEDHPDKDYPTEVDAAVIDVREGGMNVIIKKYGLERYIRFEEGSTRFCAEKGELFSTMWEGGIQKYNSVFVKIKATSANFRFKVDVEFMRRTTTEELKNIDYDVSAMSVSK